jgi:uncharacterized protein with PhoU and TrkA domain
MNEECQESAISQPLATVSKAVLTSFLKELASTEGLSDAAANLTKAVLEDGVFAEPVIRAAILPDAT